MTDEREVMRLILEASKESARLARADVIAELRGLLERSQAIGLVEYLEVDSIRNLIDELEAAQ